MDYLARTPQKDGPSVSGKAPAIQPKPDRPEAADADTAVNRKKINRRDLINRLNYLNFQDKTVQIHFRNPVHGQTVAIPAAPQPCMNQYLVCLWREADALERVPGGYSFYNLTITAGREQITVDAVPRHCNNRGICLILPELSFESDMRSSQREICPGITTQLVQNSVRFSGTLLDFNADSFRIELHAEPPQTYHWINPRSKVNVTFSSSAENLYSGECRVRSERPHAKQREYILEPLNQIAQRFAPKEYRSQRLTLLPSPDMSFTHPLTDKLINLRITDISGSGFAVEDSIHRPSLIAGMILPAVEIRFADNLTIHCRAQVVYRKKSETDQGKPHIKCGLTFLDISIEDHRRLVSLLHRTGNRNAYVSNQVDMDELWKFFFQTGFIYPGKYHFISENKERIKETYKKLYTGNPSVATHFIYQENGSIKGHMSMIRFYHKTWLIHHHAALRSAMIRAGLVVLDQIGKFISDGCRLHSNHMDFVICYFRPENKFPNQIFGGASRLIKNPKVCSIDTFTYSHIRKAPSPPDQLPSPWTLTKPGTQNMMEMLGVYESLSGGLMLTALDLEPHTADRHNLAEEYARAGFQRERRLFALKHDNALKALFMVNRTDIALNMSDLTNCITMIVLDPESVDKAVAMQAVAILSRYFEQNKFPLLIYPDSFAERAGIPFEKRYNLWVLNPHFSDDYFGSLEKLMKGSA